MEARKTALQNKNAVAVVEWRFHHDLHGLPTSVNILSPTKLAPALLDLEPSAAIIGAIIHLTHDLGLKTIAEGGELKTS